MGENSTIGWTSATWNPWHGCIKVSPGCKNCYMYRDKERYGQDPRKVVRSKTTFNDPLKWKEPRMIFTCSWSDFFIAEADEWREQAWDIIRNTPHHTYQILTKRPERIAAALPGDWDRQDRWKHVWLGVSCENQKTANQRIPLLLETPAAIRWVSAEPLLGPIDFAHIDYSDRLRERLADFAKFTAEKDGNDIEASVAAARASVNAPAYLQTLTGQWFDGWDRGNDSKRLDWIVFGGESGADFRQMDVDWLRGGIEQCKAAGVKVFTKQDSGSRPGQQGCIPDELWLKEFPTAA